MATINTYRRQGFTTISNLLLMYYSKLNLTEVELILILQLESFAQKGNSFPDNKELASRTNLSPIEVAEMIQNLINKGVLQLAQDHDATGRISNYYSLDELYEKLDSYLKKHVPAFTHSENPTLQENSPSTNPIQELVRQFELEFGRLLSPIERQEVASWITVDHYDPEVIKLALREAILGQVYNFKYVDRILLNWQRHNLKTVDQVKMFLQRNV